MAEELRLQEVLRESAAVDGDEGLGPAPAVEVEGAGHQLLARAALALDEDGGVRVRHLGDQLEHRQQRRVLPDDGPEVVAPAQLLRQGADVLLQPPPLESVAGRQRDEFREARHQPGRLLREHPLDAAVVQVDHAQDLAAVADGMADHRQDQQPQHARPVPQGGIVQHVGMPEGLPRSLHLVQDAAADLELRALDVLAGEVAGRLHHHLALRPWRVEEQDHPPLGTAQLDDAVERRGEHAVQVALGEHPLAQLQEAFEHGYGFLTRSLALPPQIVHPFRNRDQSLREPQNP